MPADIGTKPVGPSRFEDLIGVLGLHCPHLTPPQGPPNPKVAALKTGVTRLLIALILFNQASLSKASPVGEQMNRGSLNEIWLGALFGFGGYIGWTVAASAHRTVRK